MQLDLIEVVEQKALCSSYTFLRKKWDKKSDLVIGIKSDLVTGTKSDLVVRTKSDLVAETKSDLVTGTKIF